MKTLHQKSITCPYCQHKQTRITQNSIGFTIRCGHCHKYLAGFDSAKEALKEWRELPAIIKNLIENGYSLEMQMNRAGKNRPMNGIIKEEQKPPCFTVKRGRTSCRSFSPSGSILEKVSFLPPKNDEARLNGEGLQGVAFQNALSGSLG